MNLDIVITGLDAEDHLAGCVESVKASSYHKGELRLWYVDLGSSDSSLLLARRIAGLQVLHARGRRLRRSEGRNLGWKRGKAPAVLFLDARSRLKPEWIETAVRGLGKGVGAVTGPRQPDRAAGFWGRALLWEDRPRLNQPAPSPGEECLVRRKALRHARGLDAKTEPLEMVDAGAWMAQHGWEVRFTEEPLAVSAPPARSLTGFLAWTFRQGLASAELRLRYGLLRSKNPTRPGDQIIRAVIRCIPASVLTGLGLAGVLAPRLELVPLLPLGAFMAVFPRVWRVGEYAAHCNLGFPEANALAWARCVAGFPWAAGFLARMGAKPWRMLRRKRLRKA
jgi:cellulose synthase/poly-beta-1,6-N-acetylglucosamine synthase-like glycosyltransferase